MTLEELKIEAAHLGYKLTKIKPYIPLLPCKCGAKRSIRFGCYSYHCCFCGLSGKPAKFKYQARENWNKAVKGAKE